MNFNVACKNVPDKKKRKIKKKTFLLLDYGEKYLRSATWNFAVAFVWREGL